MILFCKRFGWFFLDMSYVYYVVVIVCFVFIVINIDYVKNKVSLNWENMNV